MRLRSKANPHGALRVNRYLSNSSQATGLERFHASNQSVPRPALPC